jgi:rubrerythrin
MQSSANVYADHHAAAIHHQHQSQVRLFPTWLPGTRASLLHDNQQVTGAIPDYIRTAAHTPDMKQYLIQRSQTATGRDTTWNDDTFDLIAWQPLSEAMKQHMIGQRTQISKYMNDLLPTLQRLQTFNNNSDSRCFACGLLWEDTNHIIQCPCDARHQARMTAFNTFKQQLEKQHTPTIMTTLLTECMSNWIHCRCIALPDWPLPHKPIVQQLT